MALLDVDVTEEDDTKYLRLHFPEGIWASECPIGYSTEDTFAALGAFIERAQRGLENRPKMH